jgi:integrase
MAILNKLTALQINQLTAAGRYADGGGLYLYIKESGTKVWEFRYQLNKKRHFMGLGSFDKKSNGLADARKRAVINRTLVAEGIDPLEQAKEMKAERIDEIERKRKAKKAEARVKSTTFKFCAERFIDNKKDEWKNAKHKQQWENTLALYVYPIIGDLPIDQVEMSHIRKILDPIWSTKTETASRVRQRIEVVISSAIAVGDRMTANPATWKGLLDNFYPKPEKVKKKRNIEQGKDGHFPALDYEDMPAFMAELVKLDGIAALALRFLILTVPRTTELRLAKPDELNIEKKIWTIPEGRMKAGVRHRVALSDAAIKTLEITPRINDYIFAGWKRGSPLSDGGFRSVLKRMGRLDITVHGFRSTFRDYIGEETGFPDRLAEFALAHQLTDEAEKAYARGDKLKKRFDMMNAWAEYVDSLLSSSNVLLIDQ